jgi:hypothetical protein
MYVDWKKSSPDDFFETLHGCRQQKARFLLAASARRFARADVLFESHPKRTVH